MEAPVPRRTLSMNKVSLELITGDVSVMLATLGSTVKLVSC